MVSGLRYQGGMNGKSPGVMEREVVMKELAGARWYVTLIVAAVSMIGLMILVVAAVEVLTAAAAGPFVPPPWHVSLVRVNEAVERKDYPAAARLWHEAYLAATNARRWEGLVEVADTYRRLGELGGFEPAARTRARELYLTALFRARGEASLDGVLRVAAAFVELEDREVVEQCIQIAQHVAQESQDPLGPQRVRMFVNRWNGTVLGAERTVPPARR
jgi:hypothetical protein